MGEDIYDGCGISRVWSTSPDDPFYTACQWHDKAYSEGSWESKHLTRLQVDQQFLDYMKHVAHTTFNKARAYLFYSVARSIGWKWW